MLDFAQVSQRMDKILEIFSEDITSIRTGRATPGLIENVVVEVYNGQKMKLVELGSISVPDVRSLVFEPWDKTVLREISNGIQAANIGMMPIVDGELIRFNLPMLTVEQREDYIKLLGRKLEGAKNMFARCKRRFRKKIMDAKNDKEISEDEFKRDEAELQKMTDNYMDKIEAIAKKKEGEIRA